MYVLPTPRITHNGIALRPFRPSVIILNHVMSCPLSTFFLNFDERKPGFWPVMITITNCVLLTPVSLCVSLWLCGLIPEPGTSWWDEREEAWVWAKWAIHDQNKWMCPSLRVRASKLQYSPCPGEQRRPANLIFLLYTNRVIEITKLASKNFPALRKLRPSFSKCVEGIETEDR